MRGGPSITVLLNIALGEDIHLAKRATEVLKTQVFLYDSDIKRIEDAFNQKNLMAKELLESFSKAEFFTKLPELDEEIKIITYVAAEGDILNGFIISRKSSTFQGR
ncbi:MAG: hypothetical protein CM15mP117_05550 [Alphaproteobacteria bacterium]|nr:MAG: hypothetical protein CM15mP117_05550 [Alphaproteobacteria bacterium]